jgi:hypothetical protein
MSISSRLARNRLATGPCPACTGTHSRGCARFHMAGFHLVMRRRRFASHRCRWLGLILCERAPSKEAATSVETMSLDCIGTPLQSILQPGCEFRNFRECNLKGFGLAPADRRQRAGARLCARSWSGVFKRSLFDDGQYRFQVPGDIDERPTLVRRSR